MKGIIAIALLLTASLIGNVALIVCLSRTTASNGADPNPRVSSHPPVAETVGQTAPNEIPAAKESELSFEDALHRRAEELRENGLSGKLVAAALVPSVARHFTDRILEHDSLRESAQEAGLRRNAWKDVMESQFGSDIGSESSFRGTNWNDPFNHRRKFELTYQFESDEAGETHRVLGSLGGVSLTQQEKAAVVEISREFGEDRQQVDAELRKVFDDSTTDQILLGSDPDYHNAYKRSITLANGVGERARMAKILYEIGRTRREGLARWQAAEISEAEKSSGIRILERQITEYLREELGEPAVELIRANGY